MATEDITGGLYKVSFSLLSATTGAASSATTALFNGMLLDAIFKPDSGGTQPTDAFDITILDADSTDVLQGLGANLSNAAPTYKKNTDGLGYVKSSALTCNGAAMGEGKGATVILYILPMQNPS